LKFDIEAVFRLVFHVADANAGKVSHRDLVGQSLDDVSL
jgi:hypothetical protein